MADGHRNENTETRRSLAARTPLESSFTPDSWHTIGSFQYQRRDTEIGWLFPDGGAGSVGSGQTIPEAGGSLPSAFAAESSVEWRTTTASDTAVEFPQAFEEMDPTGGGIMPLLGSDGLFDDFQDWYGRGDILYSIGYAFTTFEMERSVVFSLPIASVVS